MRPATTRSRAFLLRGWPSCRTSSASRTRPATSPSRWTCCDGGPRALADELDRALKDAVV